MNSYEDRGIFFSSIDCNVYYARKKGKQHFVTGKPCQDYNIAENIADDIFAVAVADGHGGYEYTHSNYGSQLACKCLIKLLKNKLERMPGSFIDREDDLIMYIKSHAFKKEYIDTWKESVIHNFIEQSPNIELSREKIIKKYGTTILFAIVTRNYYVLGQLGDGAILLFNNKSNGQLFKRHQNKIDSTTRSLVSSKGIYSLVVDSFKRDLFRYILLSTDGIYDKLDNSQSFLLYGNELAAQIEKNKDLINPFTIMDIDVSTKTKDDCTISLLNSNTTIKSSNINELEQYGYSNIEFIRAYDEIAIFKAKKDELLLYLYVSNHQLFLSQEDFDKPLISTNCLYTLYKRLAKKWGLSKSSQDSSCLVSEFFSMINHLEFYQLKTGEYVFVYNIPADVKCFQMLYEYGETLEKRNNYSNNDTDFVNDNLFDNVFWLKIYEKLQNIYEFLDSSNLFISEDFFKTFFVSSNGSIYVLDFSLLRKGNTSFNEFKEFMRRFGIFGKICCGNLQYPLFYPGSENQGQTINHFGHNASNTPMLKLIYNKEINAYGLWNISKKVWYIEDDGFKKIMPGKVLKLDKNKIFNIPVQDDKENSSELSKNKSTFAQYKVKLF